MISTMTSAPPVALTPEDQLICTGQGRRMYSGVSSAVTDSMNVRAGTIYKMRKGDRLDFAKIQHTLDMEWRDYPEKHYYRAFC